MISSRVEARPDPASSTPPVAGWWRAARRLTVPLMLLALLWAVRYWRSAEFGLYEDDLTFIPRAVQMTLPELAAFVITYIVNLYGHARPLSDSFIHVFSSIGWKLDGLQGIYAIGFLIEAANVLLFYGLLRRLRPLSGFAVLGALAYLLFSADTTQSFLTHSLGLQPSLTLLLLALHAWLSGRRVLAYGLAFVILFAYESPYPVFFAAPLLNQPWDRRLPRRLLGHAAVAGLLLVFAAGVKTLAGEERVAGMSAAEAILTPINHMLVGPAASLATFALRPLEAMAATRVDVLLLAIVVTGLIVWVLGKLDMGARAELADSVRWVRGKLRRRSGEGAGSAGPAAAPIALRLLVAGLAMWVLAYPLTYTTLGYHIRGRPTRVHLAAVVGSSLTVAAVGTAVIAASQSAGARRWRSVGVAVWMGLLAGYGLVLQTDYVRAWELQRLFWSRLLPLVPDAGEGTVILVDPTGIEDTYQIAANTWNLPRVLDQLLAFPSVWKDPPRVYRLTADWESSILEEPSQVRLDAATTVAPPSLYGTFPVGRVILIETETDPWHRREGTVIVGPRAITLETGEGRPLDAAPRLLLYDLLLGTEEDSPQALGSIRRSADNGKPLAEARQGWAW